MSKAIVKFFSVALTLLISLSSCVALGQVVRPDTIRVDSSHLTARPQDTIHKNIPQVGSVFKDKIPPRGPKYFQPNPKKAGLYSSIVPGLGQAYNRQYWKVPVIYAGIGVAGYFFFRNLNFYQSYRQAYISRINNPSPSDKYVNIYDNAQLQQLQNDYNKYLDLTVLFSGIGYALQVIDAITSAHLKNFDISRDISMQVSPVAFPRGAGMAVAISFR